nr:immunoglobulin heavy chain junction region [Mus musculus]
CASSWDGAWFAYW